MFKIGFQNCNTISKNKLTTLQSQLSTFDIIFLSEINKKNFSFANSDVFQHHVDSEVPRIAMIGVNTVKVKPIGVGICLSQQRVQIDQTAVQSYVYEVKTKSQTKIIENFYLVPDAKSEIVNQVIQHINAQSIKYDNYCCGGDFNLNWTSKNIRKLFLDFSSFTQLVDRPTRCRKYFKDGKQRFSNTTIDLFFSNGALKTWIGTVVPVQISDVFDHKLVSVSFRKKSHMFFRRLKKPTNHLIRPTPSPPTVEKINAAITNIDADKRSSFDSFFGEIRSILDELLPFNPPGKTEFIIYRCPFPENVVKEIKLKHTLEKIALQSNANEEKYRKQRNKVSNLVKRAKKSFFNNLLKRSPPEGIQDKLKFIQLGLASNLKSDIGRIELEGFSGQALADRMSLFYKNRAENLVTDDEIWEAGCSPPPLRPGESLPNQLCLEFPIYDDLYEFLPKNKISNSCGLSGISAKVLEFIWPAIKDTLTMLVNSNSFSYPKKDMGYYQRTIPKTTKISILKDLRPLGVLDPVVKYLVNKPAFKQLRQHIEPILRKRNNFSYRGTHLCIIKTFDNILESIAKKKPTMMVKYDFSNAFGTLHHESVIHVLHSLNLSQDALQFFHDYLDSQKYAKTFVSDDNGLYVSDLVTMERGCAQGQIGADVLFIIQQLVLKELDQVFRTLYLDDLNDNISSDTTEETLRLSKKNQQQLVQQSQTIGFAINDGKTTNIPFNISDEDLEKNKFKFVRESFVLGMDFLATKKGPDLTPATDAIIRQLNSKISSIHASRAYMSFEDRVLMARAAIYPCLGGIHLILGYDHSVTKPNFERIRVKVNELLRATGLRRTTPCEVLDQVLGTNLKKFTLQCLIMDGIKTIDMTLEEYLDERTDLIRHRYAHNTFMTSFVEYFNLLDKETRQFLKSRKNYEQMKNHLKTKRKLDIKFDEVFQKYHWIDFNEPSDC